MSRHLLTPTLQAAICGHIFAGGFPQVAAEAAGLPREVFERWLRQGRARGARRKYRLFYEAVMQARAQVRLAAECKALAKDPLAWLKSGPGKETPDAPGWTNPLRGLPQGDTEAVNFLLRRETQELVLTLLRLLQPFPEARAAVAEALAAPEAPATTEP